MLKYLWFLNRKCEASTTSLKRFQNTEEQVLTELTVIMPRFMAQRIFSALGFRSSMVLIVCNQCRRSYETYFDVHKPQKISFMLWNSFSNSQISSGYRITPIICMWEILSPSGIIKLGWLIPVSWPESFQPIWSPGSSGYFWFCIMITKSIKECNPFASVFVLSYSKKKYTWFKMCHILTLSLLIFALRKQIVLHICQYIRILGILCVESK